MVAGHRLGDGPDAPKDPVLQRRRLVFDCSPENAATVLLALERARKDLPPSATDEDALLALAEARLADGRDASHQPPYQVALTLCAGCGRTWRQVAGEAVEIPPVAGECARCDEHTPRCIHTRSSSGGGGSGAHSETQASSRWCGRDGCCSSSRSGGWRWR